MVPLAATVIAQEKKTIPLFNGQNLDGWYTFLKSKGKNSDPDKVFSVIDGVIRVSGMEYGSITTNEKYENYTLEVEYKVGEHAYPPRQNNAYDSGILLHSVGADAAFNDVWMNSIEVQVIEGGTGDFFVVSNKKNDNFSITSTVDPNFPAKGGGGLFKPDGVETTVYTPSNPVHRIGFDLQNRKDVSRFRNTNEIEKPHGEWNLVKCVADGDTIDVYLNGQLVNHAFQVKPHKGRIQIQSEGAEFFYRRIDLTPLPKGNNQ
jgi:hypothetical protein